MTMHKKPAMAMKKKPAAKKPAAKMAGLTPAQQKLPDFIKKNIMKKNKK